MYCAIVIYLRSWHDDVAAFCQDLTSSELHVFRNGKRLLEKSILLRNPYKRLANLGHKSAQEVLNWRNRQISRLRVSQILNNRGSVGEVILGAPSRLKRPREEHA